tara:strand:- start:2 stop:1060 length:1059 start_codon:yes stop_codon:yes gene_type:complete
MNAQKVSSPQKFIGENGIEIEQTTRGTLYVIDDGYSPISPPQVNSESFSSLMFIDNRPESDKLELSIENKEPSNNWTRQIQNNQLTDYYIPNQKDLVEIKSGIMIFNLPRYDQQDSITCNYKFPQLNHSYVIKNTISNVRGSNKEHFIVITPIDDIYVPCFTPTTSEKYELIESQIRIMEQIDNVDNQLVIDGQPIILKTTRSQPITQLKADEGFKCKFYCVCESVNIGTNVHPFYGTTDIITDTSLFDCDECEDKAESYCSNIGNTCKPKVFTDSCIGDKSNLYTKGDEYLLPNGDTYVGFYHLHNQIPMVGPIHTIEEHETLTPIKVEESYSVDRINYITTNGLNTSSGY